MDPKVEAEYVGKDVGDRAAARVRVQKEIVQSESLHFDDVIGLLAGAIRKGHRHCLAQALQLEDVVSQLSSLEGEKAHHDGHPEEELEDVASARVDGVEILCIVRGETVMLVDFCAGLEFAEPRPELESQLNNSNYCDHRVEEPCSRAEHI